MRVVRPDDSDDSQPVSFIAGPKCRIATVEVRHSVVEDLTVSINFDDCWIQAFGTDLGGTASS